MTNWTGFSPGEQWIPTMGTATGYWVTTSLPTVAFTGTTYAYGHFWSQWATYTWAAIMSTGVVIGTATGPFLWEELAGYTFITPAKTNVTVWS